MDPRVEYALQMNRRHFLGRSGLGLGAAALATLVGADGVLGDDRVLGETMGSASAAPHFAPRAKRVIYLFQSGAPSQIDLFDNKPLLRERFQGAELPDSVRRGQRLTGMTSRQASFPIASSKYKFAQHGASGAWLSELLPHTSGVADQLCFVKSMFTEAINHDPAITFFQTGAQLAGRPSIGSWLSYGLGSENQDLPAFVALISQGSGNTADQPLYDRLWGSGFLPTRYQGVKFRSVGDPVLFLSNPPGIDGQSRREMLNDLGQLNELQQQEFGDPETATRIAQYELAYRMQSAVPELTNLAGESQQTLDMYGPEAQARLVRG